jgi:oligopeptide/dipeptide ABC transporter ATP-binding protein
MSLSLAELLSIQNLEVSLKNPVDDKQGTVLRGISLKLDEGQRVALVGESGCGKSMTALSILSLLPQPPMEITGGTIRFKDKDISHLTREEWEVIRGKDIGIVFQDPITSLNPVFTVGLQIEETLQKHLELSKSEARQSALNLLTEVGLPDAERVIDQYPHQLSGGMCQRVMIAIAVACDPVLLIADEPTTALDVTVQAQILDLVFKLTRQNKMAVLLITHDLRIVKGHADRVVILYAGEVMEEGTPTDIFEHAQHPYTEGLLASMPQFESRGHDLASIGGVVPSPFEQLIGCAFAERCSKVKGKCRVEKPDFVVNKTGHGVRCFYPSEK